MSGCMSTVSLTVHSSKNQQRDTTEFYIRCQVEVLFGVLVNLKEKFYLLVAKHLKIYNWWHNRKW